MSEGSEPQSLFEVPDVQIAVISSAISGTSVLGYAHYLQALTGLQAGHYSLSKGGSLAAMSAYVTSREFQENRPAFLVWTLPIWENIARFGDQPMQELITAAGPTCETVLPMAYDKDRNLYQADLSGLDQSQPHTLFLDSDNDNDSVSRAAEGAGAARFTFTSQSGAIRTRTIYRAADQVLTGRFYMPMSGLWPEGADRVDIQLGGLRGKAAPRLRACQHEESN